MVTRDPAVPEERQQWHRRIRPRDVLALWGGFIALLLLWQVLKYRGLMALAAEWQFNTFGRYYPTLTYVLIVAILASPVLFLLRRRPRGDADVRDYDEPVLPGRNFIRTLLGVGAACWVAAVVVGIAALSLPTDSGPANRLVIGSPAAAEPPLGPTILVGDAVRDRVAGFDEDLLIARRSSRFVPVLSPGSRGEGVRFFAEVANPDTLTQAGREGSLSGILRERGLPGELVRLFRYAGFDVADRYYVLYANRDSLTWSSRMAVLELFLAGVICAVIAGLLHLRRERVRRGTTGGAVHTPA